MMVPWIIQITIIYYLCQFIVIRTTTYIEICLGNVVWWDHLQQREHEDRQQSCHWHGNHFGEPESDHDQDHIGTFAFLYTFPISLQTNTSKYSKQTCEDETNRMGRYMIGTSHPIIRCFIAHSSESLSFIVRKYTLAIKWLFGQVSIWFRSVSSARGFQNGTQSIGGSSGCGVCKKPSHRVLYKHMLFHWLMHTCDKIYVLARRIELQFGIVREGSRSKYTFLVQADLLNAFLVQC